MKRLPLSLAEYQCRRCGAKRLHGEYITYAIRVQS